MVSAKSLDFSNISCLFAAGVDLKRLNSGQMVHVPLLAGLGFLCSNSHRQAGAGSSGTAAGVVQQSAGSAAASVAQLQQQQGQQAATQGVGAAAAVLNAIATGQAPPNGMVAIKVRCTDL